MGRQWMTFSLSKKVYVLVSFILLIFFCTYILHLKNELDSNLFYRLETFINRSREDVATEKMFFPTSDAIVQNKHHTPIRSNKTENETKEALQRSMEKEFARRNILLQEKCRQFYIKPDNVFRLDWNVSKCVPIREGYGYTECIAASHFLLARPSYALTCHLNKVASTSISAAFLESNGRTFLPPDEASVHYVTKFIVPQTKKEIEFAVNYFFKFMAVRNPFDRLLSAYLDKVVYGAHPSLKGLRKDILISLYENQNYLFQEEIKPDRRRSQSISPSGNDTSLLPTFEEFLNYILLSDLQGVGFDSHWVPYWRWCAPCSMHYDVIVKLESELPELQYVWQRMNYSKVDSVPWLHKTVEKVNRKKTKSFYYAQLSPKIINEVYNRYYLDFQLFEYDIYDILKLGRHCSGDDCRRFPR